MESTVVVPRGDGILPALFSTEAILLFDTEGTAKTTLLVVDSDRGLLEVCSIVLGRAGYKVLAAEGIRNAFIICRDSNLPAIQLLLLDALCPGAEGVDLVKFLRLGNPDVHILFMSPLPPHELELLYGMATEVPVLQKPFTIPQLLAAVESTRMSQYSKTLRCPT